MILNLVPRTVLMAALAAASLWGAYQTYSKHQLALELSHTKTRAAEAEAFFAAQYADAERELARVSQEYREQETQLAKLAETNRRLTNENIAASRLAAAGIRDRLRDAPALPQVSLAGDVSSTSGAATSVGYPPGSFGALLRGAAEPLVGETERADVLRAHLIECRALYGRARDMQKGSP